MIYRPNPTTTLQASVQDLASFLGIYPQVPAWQATLSQLLQIFPNLTTQGRGQAAGIIKQAAKALSASQQNALSNNRVLVWEYLWGLKVATRQAYVAMQVGQLSQNQPPSGSSYGLSVTQGASAAITTLSGWHPDMPPALQTAAPGNIVGLLGSLANGTLIVPEAQLTQPTASAYQVHILQYGDTLRSLATTYLGDPSRWTEIQALNNLRYPYISSDLQDEYGPPLAQWILQSVQTGTSAGLYSAPPILSGATSAELPGPDISVGNAIVLSQAGSFIQDIRIVQSVSGSTVYFSEPVDDNYPAGSMAYLCPTPQNQSYQVLGYGDPIKLPLPSSTTIAPSAVTAPDLNLGTDIAVNAQGYLYLTNQGDLATVSSMANLQQAILNRINTEVGALPLWSAYGSHVLSLLGQNPIDQVMIMEIEATLLQDPRIQAVQNAALAVGPPTSTNPSPVSTFTADIVLAGYTGSPMSLSVPLTRPSSASSPTIIFPSQPPDSLIWPGLLPVS